MNGGFWDGGAFTLDCGNWFICSAKYDGEYKYVYNVEKWGYDIKKVDIDQMRQLLKAAK